MSSSFPLTQPPGPLPDLMESQASQASVFGPGIAGLLIQGIETGLVIALFSQWFARSEHSGNSVLSTVVVFVTIVGLAQSGIYFATVWSKYVQRFGMPLVPDWEDFIQSGLSHIVSFPVQTLMVRRCYYLLGKNMFIITPLVLLLAASIIMTSWSTVLVIHFMTITAKEDWALLPQKVGLVKPYLMSLILPSVLDLILTAILLHFLIQTMKRVYAPHKRKRIARLVNIVWQSALPPSLCAICAAILYILFSTAPSRIAAQIWLPIVQAMIGKLYILSFFYMVNAQPLQPDERPTNFMISTLTLPTGVMCTETPDACVGGTCNAVMEVHASGPDRTVDSSV